VRRASRQHPGGPDRFEESIRRSGGAGIRDVAVVKADGGMVGLELTADRAFLFESLTADLEARILPWAAASPNWRLVETVTLLAAG
jgi:hypothetical protein